MAVRLTKRRFLDVIEAYRPSRFEEFGDDPRFVRRMHHARKCRERLFVALRSGLALLPDGAATVVDFGPYPGSLLRLLRAFRGTVPLQLYGAGLMADPEFVQWMKEACGAEIMTVNLDPANPQFRTKGYAEKVPLPAGSAQLVFALEIIEHLASPFHLVEEAYRLLVPRGHLVITTPNVTRIGNLFKLLVGRTIHDRLAPPGYFNPGDEWQPHVREYAMGELADILRRAGFEVVDRRFFLGEDTQDCARPARQRGIDAAKWPFYLVPHLRGSLLIVVRKPGNVVRHEA
jgi:SAM-dependent methyltransferase